MKFWWYIEWPKDIRKYTLKYQRKNKDGKLISINVLEYAAMIINYVACSYYFHIHPDPSDPFPLVRLFGDNSSAESWMTKTCTSSLAGRALGRILCALMIDNPVGNDVQHVTTEDNDVADAISRIKSESDTLRGIATLMQDCPELAGSRRFQPSSTLISLIMDAISQKKLIDPMIVASSILTTPGQFTT